MTTIIQDNKVTLECDGAETEFDFSFKYLSNSDIKVYVIDIDSVAADADLQTEGSDYTLTSSDKSLGGTITFGTAPADTKQVFIMRSIPLTQNVPFKPNTNFPEQIIEMALDKLTLIAQGIEETIQRCIKMPINSYLTGLNLPNPETGKTLKWNAAGDGFDNSDTSIDDIQSSLDAAAASASEAAASAELAQAATGDVPSPVALNYLRQKSDASGFEYRTPTQVGQDIPQITKVGVCATASATAEKAVVCAGFELVEGVTIQITFDNANTHATPTLNINSKGALSPKNMQGDALKYIPANIPLDFRYDGTDLIGLYTNTFAGMPDYSNPISKTWNTDYTAECDGWVKYGGDGIGSNIIYLYINGAVASYISGAYNVTIQPYLPVSKGSIYKATGGSGGALIFYPSKGAN